MHKMKRILAAVLAVMMIAGAGGLSALAAGENEFGIEKYVAFGDSIGAGVNYDAELGEVPMVPTGEFNEDGTPKRKEVFGTSRAGYVTQLAGMLGLRGSGRADTIRGDDQFRSWAFAGLRTTDILYFLDPSFNIDQTETFFQMFSAQTGYEQYRETMIADVRSADLITLVCGGNDLLTAPMIEAMVEMYAEAETEEEILTIQAAQTEAEDAAKGEQGVGASLQNITEMFETIGTLNQFLQKFLPKSMEGYRNVMICYPKLIARLRELNPTAQIVLQCVPNPLHRMSLTNNGMITIGQFMDAFPSTANLTIRKAAAQYGCEYQDILTVECDASMHPVTAGYKEIAEGIVSVLRPVKTGYRDVPEGSWYEDGVNYVTEKGMMAGTGERMFSPDAAVTRGMIAQILYAAEGRPAADTSAGFRDVPDGRWYSDAVNWCVSAGLAAGYTDGTFRPEDAVTRQQLAAILYQYASVTGKDTSAGGSLRRYPDAGEVQDYAVTAMQWAVGHRLISGSGTGLDPEKTATRAQVAVILQAFGRL